MTPDAAQHAIYFNGRSNRRRSVALRLADGGLEIVEEGDVADTWPYADMRRADGPLDVLRLSSVTALPLARLEITDAAMKAAIAARATSLDAARGGTQTWRIVFWSLAAVCSIVSLAVFGIPLVADRLAPLIPFSFEKRMGDSIDGHVQAMFGGKVCNGAAGQAAFSALVDRLKGVGAIDTPLKAQVLSSIIPNAFALPGGNIYLLNGLLQKANNVDEVAGVLAHELGHVKHRDHVRRIIQTGGTSFLFGLLFGDVSGAGAVIFASRSLVDASYSREAEQDADAFAADVMHRLGRSPAPMGEFLVRVTAAQPGAHYTIFASHPMSEARLAAMKKESRPITGAELLSAAQWQALKNICK